ncbi:prospero homeobox protein 2 [Engraulis encrasicolus]|uniref:prospero homeobox protein 2 n=1 Tax=Engraulis encrasicolus TaxID=184585 RepID=UPI002FD43F74
MVHLCIFEEPLQSAYSSSHHHHHHHHPSIISHLLRRTIHNKKAMSGNGGGGGGGGHMFYLPATAASPTTLSRTTAAAEAAGQEDEHSIVGGSSSKSIPEISESESASEVRRHPPPPLIGPNEEMGGERERERERERPISDHIEAKRARVENIIRGMAGSGSPNSRLQGNREDVADGGNSDPEMMTEQHERKAEDAAPFLRAEKKRKQKLPQHQGSTSSSTGSPGNGMLTSTPSNRDRDRGGLSVSISTSKAQECQKLRAQLQNMQRLLQQLEEKFFQVYDRKDAEKGRRMEEEEEKGRRMEEDEKEQDDDEDEENSGGHTKRHDSFIQQAGQSGSEASFHSEMEDDGGDDGEEQERPDWLIGSGQRDRATPTAAEVSYVVSKGEERKLQETLKYELSKAVNESIDSVFQKISSTLLLNNNKPPHLISSSHHRPDPADTTERSAAKKRIHNNMPYAQPELSADNTAADAAACVIRPLRPPQYCQSPTTPTQQQPPTSPDHQTEALSLVIHKSPSSSTSQSNPSRPEHPTAPNPTRPSYALHHHHQHQQQPAAAFPYSYATAAAAAAPLHDTQILEHLLKYGPHGGFGRLAGMHSSLGRTSPDSPSMGDLGAWESLSMRAAKGMGMGMGMGMGVGVVAGGHLGQQQQHDSEDTTEVTYEKHNGTKGRIPLNTEHIQEGLTPNHLKKAKLMFFYTRYPSSNVLKAYFPDVKFNRCITSQLIKWFSNFREFYYIQMEKYARQAIVDGVNDVKGLTVARDCELFRALNVHYNKANDFQVPERFLEVAEITLQEFFTAIFLAKDSDPSWKKAIYKVICKLDSEVPEEFKTSNYL